MTLEIAFSVKEDQPTVYLLSLGDQPKESVHLCQAREGNCGAAQIASGTCPECFKDLLKELFNKGFKEGIKYAKAKQP